MEQKGREIERRVLSRAVKAHASGRISAWRSNCCLRTLNRGEEAICLLLKNVQAGG